MGFSIISYYKKIKKEYKMAFLFSFVIGLLVHFYKFANYLPNHDSMYNFYNDQNALGSGRWFLSIACGFSSYFDLPWVTGILSLLFISLTSVVIVSVFEIKNPVVIFLASGILVTFPSTTEILCFGFTSDGFFLSMLLATLAVYAIKINKTKIFNIFLSAVLVCLSCGIYQAYVSFTLVLFICYLLKNLIYDNYSVKQYIRYILSQAIAIVVGLASYFVIWKICMLVQGISANDYQGISEVGAISINTIVGAMKNTMVALVQFIFEKNFIKHGLSLFAIINVVFLVFGALIFVVAVIKNKIYKSVFKVTAILISLLALPLSMFIWFFTSPDVTYGLRMEHSISIVFIFIILLCNESIKPKWATCFSLIPLAMILNLAIQANIAYYYLNFEYENTYHEATNMANCIDSIAEGENFQIAIIGERTEKVALEFSEQTNSAFMYTSMIEKDLLLDGTHTENFLSNVLYCNYNYADSETKKYISQTDEFLNMSVWPAKDSVKIINNTVTVKLGE